MRACGTISLVTYAFRNRIMLGKNGLSSDLITQPLHEDGDEKVVLRVLMGNNFSDASWLQLEGDSYQTAEQAFDAGKMWRQWLSVSFARVGIGADFDPMPPTSGAPGDLPTDRDAPGLIVFSRQPGLTAEGWAPLIIHGVSLANFLRYELSAVRDVLLDGLKQRPQLDLAFRLVHLATITAHVEVKYILFVTAIEALIPDSLPLKDDEDLVAALNEIIEHTKQPSLFSSTIRNKLLGTLGYMKRESISGFGKKLAARLNGTYDGLSPADYFGRAYENRSKLVHGSLDGGSRPDMREIDREIDILRQFVLDLLSHAVENPD